MKSIKLSVLAAAALACQVNAQDTEEERVPEIVPDHLVYLYAPPPPEESDDETAHQIYAEERRWENGRKLRVCFYEGNAVVAALIRAVASEWNPGSGVTFDFGPEGAFYNCMSPRVGFPQIRIGFSGAKRGYWSFIGADAELRGGDRAPSMNLDSFNVIYNTPAYTVANVIESAHPYHKSTIRHEFGHALGLLHEHQNPALDCLNQIKWEGSDNVYDYFAAPPNGWSREQVDRNIGFIGNTDPDYVAREPDPLSVMIYSFSPRIFKEGAAARCAVPVNYEISVKDREIIAAIYPLSGISAAPVSEAIDAANITAAAIFSGEEDANDYLARVMVDLESDDTATRRNAQSRLSQVLEQNTTPNVADLFIGTLPNSSVGYRLRVASVLSNVEGEIPASSDSAKILTEQMTATRDTTLRNALQNLQQKLEIE